MHLIANYFLKVLHAYSAEQRSHSIMCNLIDLIQMSAFKTICMHGAIFTFMSSFVIMKCLYIVHEYSETLLQGPMLMLICRCVCVCM